MSKIQAGPTQDWQYKSLACYVAQEGSREESNEEKYEKIVAEKEVQVVAEEELEDVNLGLVHKDQGLSRLVQV